MAMPVEQHELPEKTYQNVSPSDSEDESDFDNDSIVRGARDSTEVANYDREILDEEEERENLLTAGSKGKMSDAAFGARGSHRGPMNKTQKERITRRNKGRRREATDGEGKAMLEMEEGGPASDISSQASVSSVELDKFNGQRRSNRRRNAHCAIISASILVLFVVLIFGAYRVSRDTNAPLAFSLLSNGTSSFAPTTILISLDGFRADFLHRGISPTLSQFIAEGVSPRWMLPSFPSVTFPNHYTIVTGMYPESHGIVGNTFWDPNFKEEFDYGQSDKSMQSKWWTQAEPLWVTAEKQGVKTGIHMWPGSEAGVELGATYLDKYNGSEVLPRKVERILEWLDMPNEGKDESSRPQLIQVYVPNVDAAAHNHGPNGTEVWDSIADVDEMLHDLFVGLSTRNLTDIVNVVVVSDHGMATTSTDRTIQLDDIIDMDMIAHSDGWPLYGLRPENPEDLKTLYDRLSAEAERNPNFDVYLRDENMPERYHFANNDRIAPLWVVPKTGWAIVQKDEFNVEEAKASGERYNPKGLHGYDNEDPLMRAIFIARGPAFPHEPNSRVDDFKNVEVYNMLCDSIGIKPKPNNGTLRLPLKPIGLHSDEPDDSLVNDGQSENPPESKQDDLDLEDTDFDTAMNETSPTNEDESEEELDDFWSYMKAKMKAAIEWAHGVVQSIAGSKKPDDEGAEF